MHLCLIHLREKRCAVLKKLNRLLVEISVGYPDHVFYLISIKYTVLKSLKIE